MPVNNSSIKAAHFALCHSVTLSMKGLILALVLALVGKSKRYWHF